MLTLPPLSLYIHIPWCVRKCPYCDFNSHAVGTKIPEQEYVAALIQDLANDQKYTQGRKLCSIFFGGGTPSLFSAQSIADILSAAEKQIGFESTVEITLEANPGTFEQEKFQGFRAAGVNRLSIGIQSFDDLHLQQLGRIHSSSEAGNAVSMARSAGFDNFNLDLMHGLPGQSVTDALNDLQKAVTLGPAHLSWYQLTIEPNTEFYSNPPQLPDDPVLDSIFGQGQQLLSDNGFIQYEVSAYARGDQMSVHNLNYWEFGDYVGIGAGAHGKITLPDKNRIVRTRKTRTPKDYLARTENYNAAVNDISRDELPLEFLMNALRLNRGVPTHYFPERTGQPLSLIASPCKTLQNKGLLQTSPDRLQATSTGHQFLNTLLSEF